MASSLLKLVRSRIANRTDFQADGYVWIDNRTDEEFLGKRGKENM